jgi:protein-disulfide isomerase
MSKRFLLTLVVIIVGFVGFGFMAGHTKKAPPAAHAVSNHVYGDAKSKVTFIEYGDYQCPVCGEYEPIMAALRQKYQGSVNFQFRNFPLPQHANALAAAHAAEAASLQGKFWQMHDLLYANQNEWVPTASPFAVFDGYAKDLKLNMAQFKTDASSQLVNNTILADEQAGNTIGITGTPMFVLNGKLLSPTAPNVAAFSAVLDAALDKSTQ